MIRSFLSDITLSDTLKLVILLIFFAALSRWEDMARLGGFGA